ncbi:serine/threonine-protein kinase [Rheinheimera muenzenbergensis]|uniref:Serine/threonine-protein kinase n=1 Tax=Rheinheimera muenzenbergensis TaxID=1193628 RepID=A0ABU8C1D5_9GAMM
MDKQTWQQAEQIYFQAIELPEQQRAAFIASNCQHNDALAGLVQQLLSQQGATVHIQQLLAAGAADVVNLQQDLSGTALGPYRLLHLLGRGGMGAVYLAERADQQFEKQVAIKLINTTLVQPELLHAFKTERQILADLEHSYICRLLDGGTTAQGLPYLVMEYIQGESIDHYCHARQLSVIARLQLMVKVASAVAYAHQNMVVHCDLKPSNILIAAGGEPKLLDFGIARLLGRAAATDPVQQSRRLTPHYAAPELIQSGSVTTLSDVYSLAVVLQQLLGQQQTTDLQWILTRALQSQPAQRYHSVAAFASDLKRYLGRYPVYARPDSWWYRSQMFVRRNRASSVLAGLGLVAVGGFSLVLWLQSLQVAQQRDQARIQRDKAQAITAFVTGMLASVDPFVAQGQVPTVQQILDQSSQSLQRGSRHALLQQPEVEAAVRQVIGRTYFSLGDLASAQGHLEQAKVLAEQHQFTDTELYLSIISTLAGLYKDRYQTAEVLRLSYQALSLAEQLYGVGDIKTLGALSDLASAYHTAGELVKAEQMWQRLYQQRLTLLGDQHPDIVNSLVNLGIINHWLGRYLQAEQYYQQCLDKAIELLTEMHPTTLQCMSTLGSVYEVSGRYAEAEPVILRHIALAQQVLGAKHPDTLRSKHNLADTYRGLGRLADAEALFRQVLAQRRVVLGHDNIETLQSQMKLARVLLLQQQTAEAQPLLIEAYTKMQSQLGADHPSALTAGQLLADVYLTQQNYQSAFTLYLQILQQREQRQGPHPDSVDTLAALAQVHFQLQEPDQAQQRLQQAEQLAQQFPQHNSKRLQKIKTSLMQQ